MPKKMPWTELLFSYLPTGKTLRRQMLARFIFLFLVWLVGLLAYALDGLMTEYVLDLRLYLTFFVTNFLMLYGIYMMQHELKGTIEKIRPMLKLDDPQFQKFSERVERYSYSFIPCLSVAIGFMWVGGWQVFLSPNELQQVLAGGSRLHVIWDLSSAFLFTLLGGTSIWMFMSFWIAIFLISRQPLSVELSPKTIERFRDLSMLALWLSLGYFLGLSLSTGIIAFPTGAPASSFLDIVLTPYLLLIAIGIIGILLPFYNIHKALLNLKEQELAGISEETEKSLQQLDEILEEQPARQFSDQTITIMARIFSLQAKERRMKAAQEWPIDIGFLSKLMGLGLIPIISRIALDILSRYL